MIETQVAIAEIDGAVRLEESSVSAPGYGEAQVKSCFSSMSPGTESALLAGSIVPLPQRIGYSLAGEVVAVGEGLEGFAVGSRVVSTASHATVQNIPGDNLTLVPEAVDLEDACFFNLAHTALYAIRQSELQFGQPVLIIGQGLVGQLITVLARAAGIAPIVVVDLDAQRLDLAKASGADYCFGLDNLEVNIGSVLTSLGVAGFPAVIEASGRAEPLQQAIRWVAERGRVVMMSTTAAGDSALDLQPLMMKGAALVGGYVNSKPFRLSRTDLEIVEWPPTASRHKTTYQVGGEWSSEEDIKVFLNLLRFNRISLSHLITHRFEWRDISQAYSLVSNADAALMGGIIAW